MTSEGAGQDPSCLDGKCQLLLVEEVFGTIQKKKVVISDTFCGDKILYVL